MRDLFGSSRVYLPVKKLVGQQGKTQSIPDGYLLDFSRPKKPVLYIVEVELAKHDPLRHIAQQLLGLSLSFKSTRQKMKGILRNTLQKSSQVLASCEQYAANNGFNNIDYLLEQMIYPEDAFNALMIIDELEEGLDSILHSSLRFPVEPLVIERYRSSAGELAYHFEPFLYELSVQSSTAAPDLGNTPAIDPSEIDTIVVPAREEGFQEVSGYEAPSEPRVVASSAARTEPRPTFLGENRWYAIRIHSSMIPKIRYIAAYQVAPISAITYLTEVASIEPWKDTQKYCVNFKGPAHKIGPISLVSNGRVTAPQSIRYTSFDRLQKGRSLDDVF